MSALWFAALVEGGHGLVGGSGLNLHEEGLGVIALGTGGLGGVHVLPGRRTAQHVVDLLEFGISLVADLVLYVLHVGTGRTREAEAIGTLFNTENVGATRTEHQHSLFK